MRFDRVVQALISSAGRERPGAPAQALLAPRPRRTWIPGVVPGGMRDAAGLALLYPGRDDTLLLLTVRGADLLTHRGQVSFPGGAVEPGESVEEAALREAEEETGLAREAVTLRGRLSPLHIPVSGYVLHPVIATAPEPPAVTPCAREVDRILEASLSDLSAPGAVRLAYEEREGVEVEIPYFDLGGPRLWGATAMVVAELLALLGSTPVRPAPR